MHVSAYADNVGGGVEVGDTLEDVLGRGSFDSYQEVLLRNYTDSDSEMKELSEFFTLILEGERGVMTWKIIENKSHQVGLLREDRLVVSELNGVQWLSGRELLGKKAKSF